MIRKFLVNKIRPTLQALNDLPPGYCRAEDRLWLDGGSEFWSRIGRRLGLIEYVRVGRVLIGKGHLMVKITDAGRAALAETTK